MALPILGVELNRFQIGEVGIEPKYSRLADLRIGDREPNIKVLPCLPDTESQDLGNLRPMVFVALLWPMFEEAEDLPGGRYGRLCLCESLCTLSSIAVPRRRQMVT